MKTRMGVRGQSTALSNRGSSRASGLRAAVLALLMLAGWLPAAWADQVWEFVDGEGVTHIGNVPPSAAPRGLIWLGGVRA